MFDWSKVKSAVATSEGLLVVEEQSDGTLGAPVVYRQHMPVLVSTVVPVMGFVALGMRSSGPAISPVITKYIGPIPSELALFLVGALQPSAGKWITSGGNTIQLVSVGYQGSP